MIIGAGWEQVPLIKKAKEMGCWVLATHGFDNAEGFEFADASEVLDPRDAAKAIKLFKSYNIDAVTADNCDYALYTVGIICQKFKLPGPNFAAISNANNKKKSRMACREAGINQPDFAICNNYNDLVQGVPAVGGYPVIVKPVDNRGNFGINKVENDSELEEAFYDAVVNSHSREIIVEKFIEGTMMTVDGFCFNRGKHVSLALASKKMLGGKRRVAIEIIYPGDFSQEIITKAMAINDQVAKALSYDFGYTHSEYLVDEKGEIWLVESTNRGGGVYTSSLIDPAVTEIDLLKCLIQSACGEPVDVEPMTDSPMKNCAILSFFKFENGKIKIITGLDEVRSWPGVLRCDLSVKPGQIIESITTDANRHGFAVIVAADKLSAHTLLKNIKEKVKLEYE